MSTTITEQTIGEIVRQSPSSVRVFESLGIDYCCGGKRTFSEACERARLETGAVLALLEKASVGAAAPSDENRWSEAPLADVIAEIVNRHHAFIRTETPRLQALAAKVAKRHGAAHPELAYIEEAFTTLANELSTHMFEEERTVFPSIESVNGDALPPDAIATMVAEHEDAGELLAKMRDLSNNFQLPEGACNSFRALYQGLEEFERDLHQHVHLENNILFARAIERR